MSKNALLTITVISKCLVAATCFAGAAWVATSGKDGWEWLIIAGILIGSFELVSSKEESKNSD